MTEVQVRNHVIGNSRPITLIGGLNVIESRDLVMIAAEEFVSVTANLGIPFIFKASFDKANRSSIRSFRGPGLENGLEVLREVRDKFGIPVITDIHEPSQAAPVAEICDVLQIPAFLARQTDLIAAAAKTGAVVNVKKPQFMSPPQVRNLIEKFRQCGNEQVLLCERGACFGYDNLVVDMLGIRLMREASGDAPIVFDVTHALQNRHASADASSGRRSQVAELGRAGVAVGVAGLFLEAHPNPDEAKCDGPSALPLSQLRAFLEQIKAVDDLIKAMPKLDIP
ncbi:3-deoxy-8-phosphooctulonate synthase [Mesorhizobium sp. M0999]|uniref:3-deoxy-8-phosphooctulonate synthase n=1 Tax=Mesorhizobium sp. M0999 TaxID=2957045 RepID=UPI00333CFCB4